MSLRAYPAFADIRPDGRPLGLRGIALLAAAPVGAVAGMCLVYLAPPLLAIFGEGPARRRDSSPGR